MHPLFEQLQNARVYDLAQPYFPGMPHFPTHPPFLFSLTKRHGDFVIGDGVSSAAESFAMSGHTGTHIDSLGHFSCGGKLFGGVEAEPAQSYPFGLERLSIDTVGPILRRGVLLDVAGSLGLDALPEDFEITPAHLERASAGLRVEPGSVVLLRTGWGRFWDDPRRYVSDVRGPGPAIEGARWLSGRGVFAAGADTMSFEKMPSNAMAVHVHLLVESGIHIIECLNLEELAAAGLREFLFVASPLKIRGATGSPVRPFAVAV
jgi:kynurenine formamidase